MEPHPSSLTGLRGRITRVAGNPGERAPTKLVAQVGDALSDRWLTIPNALSILRLLGVPVFLWLVLIHEDLWAIVVLILSGLSDWLDGKLARWLDQMSKLGALLDPAADRLYQLVTLTAFAVRGIIPWWVFGVLVARDVLVAACIWILGRAGYTPPEVNYIGKAATFCLMYAFPLLLVGEFHNSFADFVRLVAIAFSVWGGVLFVWSGLLYTVQTRAALRARSTMSPGTGAAEGLS